MYEERPRRSLLKEFIMKLILIIIFVLLLLWLVPWPNMDSYMNSLNPLKDQIFNSNLQTMKEAGITYFTSERLPANVGDKTTLSLQKMLDMKLLIPFTDRNGNSCDVKASYVSLEKKETEYLMKVNLKCGDEEDYILVHLGCYSYCDGAICEKQNNKEKPSPKPKTPDNIVKSPDPTPDPIPVPDKYSCKYIGGQYWGKNYEIVTQAVYEDQCLPHQDPTPVPEKEYEYKKEVTTYYSKEYSKWSNWQEYKKKKTDNFSYNEKTEFKEVEDLGTRYEKIGTKSAVIDKFVVTMDKQVLFKNITASVCTKYKYVAEYTTTTTATVYEVVEGGSAEWHYVDHWYTGTNPPARTATSYYDFIGVDYSKCSDCVNHPVYVYREMKRDIKEGSAQQVTINDDNTVLTNLTKTCSETETRQIPVYVTVRDSVLKQVVKEPAQDIYAYVGYYRVRTRSLIHDAYTDIKIDYKWSSYNDTSLLNTGYVYTGKTRDVSK